MIIVGFNGLIQVLCITKLYHLNDIRVASLNTLHVTPKINLCVYHKTI